MSNNDNIFATIGTLVVVTQSVESLLDALLKFVLQDGQPLTSERLNHLEKAHRRKTLGNFINMMKERASFHERIEDALDRFLENRNTLVHRFREVDGHELSTDEDIKSVWAFLTQLYSDTMMVMGFCAALLHAWQQKVGIASHAIDEYKTPDTEKWIEGIKFMAAHIDTLIYAKES